MLLWKQTGGGQQMACEVSPPPLTALMCWALVAMGRGKSRWWLGWLLDHTLVPACSGCQTKLDGHQRLSFLSEDRHLSPGPSFSQSSLLKPGRSPSFPLPSFLLPAHFFPQGMLRGWGWGEDAHVTVPVTSREGWCTEAPAFSFHTWGPGCGSKPLSACIQGGLPPAEY